MQLRQAAKVAYCERGLSGNLKPILFCQKLPSTVSLSWEEFTLQVSWAYEELSPQSDGLGRINSPVSLSYEEFTR